MDKAPSPATTGLHPIRNSRALRWSLGVGLAVMVGIGLVLLFLLTQATTNRDMYERNYASLFVLNVVVAGLGTPGNAAGRPQERPAPTARLRHPR